MSVAAKNLSSTWCLVVAVEGSDIVASRRGHWQATIVAPCYDTFVRGAWAALAVLGGVALAAPAGCSLLFNGQALVGDMSAVAGDLAGGPDDLAVDDDMGGIPPLGDMDPSCG